MANKETIEKNATKQKKIDAPHFNLDVSWRFFFKELSSESLIKVINSACNTNYSLDSNVKFLDTEGRTPKGPSAIYNVREDLILSVAEQDSKEETIAIELQSYVDKSMGFRMLIYSLNQVELNKDDDSLDFVYSLPKSITFYLTESKDSSGYDYGNLASEKFRIINNGEIVYESKPDDMVSFGFPFLNLLSTSWDDLKQSDYAILQPLFMYSFIEKENKIKKNPLFKEIFKDIDTFVRKCTNETDKDALLKLWSSITIKLVNICELNKYKKDYNEELEFMQNTLRYCDVLREEGLTEGINIGREEGMNQRNIALIRKAIARGDSKEEILDFFECSEEFYREIKATI